MTLTALATFTLAFGLACASPGPTIAALVARVLGRGTSGIAAFCVGLVIGDLTWLVVASLGLAVLAEQAQPVFAAIRYAGAAYLLWLAWTLWRAPAAAPSAVAPIAGEGWRLAVTGLAGQLEAAPGGPRRRPEPLPRRVQEPLPALRPGRVTEGGLVVAAPELVATRP